ncbi:MAG: hypothetical protein HXX10_28190 [Rhodoplanes sp.]|uniref:hypothetical protein n=1 Tax=Rhodoplanes sp. TaxID=1968906 RepID=UPI0017D0355A|nr:hypothetical protein [Rhodoplanes sp.]NVO17919.1 hypothetical protein [Rhodoplanes sp.]
MPRREWQLPDVGDAGSIADQHAAEGAQVWAWEDAGEPAFDAEVSRSARTRPGDAGSDWPTRRPFDGDIPIDNRVAPPSLHPELVPEPRPAPRTPWFGMLVRWAALCMVAGGIVGVAGLSGLLDGVFGPWRDGRVAGVSAPLSEPVLGKAAPQRPILVESRPVAVDGERVAAVHAAVVAPEPAAAPPPAPAPTPVPTRRLDPDDVAALLKRGRDALATGNIAAARLPLQRAAEAGTAQAALLLGSTFDPAVLLELDVLGAVGDPAQARLWYQRAVELGSSDAARRLESLARASR